MGKINKEWHEKNKMPKNPSFEAKVKWHREHFRNCKCRELEDFPAKLKQEAKERGIKL
ncbi:MAG: hypothetical protein WC979_08440 [Candidatus Pacearchaeota archaeon]|jgi:hypothetical protein